MDDTAWDTYGEDVDDPFDPDSAYDDRCYAAYEAFDEIAAEIVPIESELYTYMVDPLTWDRYLEGEPLW